MLALILALLNDGEEAYAALQAFLATPAGKDLEAKLVAALTVQPTPGGTVLVVSATARQGGRPSFDPVLTP